MRYAIIAAYIALITPVLAADNHSLYTPTDVKWAAAPASLPKGAEAAVLYGDPTKEGLFSMRLKMPQGYHIPPHSHPGIEAVTVISGMINLGEGPTADKKNTKALPTGTFWAMPPGMQHYVYTDQETVLQINTNGPWGINYVNQKDDPRK